MSSSRSRSSNPRKIKRQKKTSVCSDCCSDKSEKNYLDSKCKKYFVDKNLVYTKTIIDSDINDYLRARNERFTILEQFELNLEYKDCIKIDNDEIKINDNLIKSKNIIISKYISNGCYGIIFISSEYDGINYIIKFIKKNSNNQLEIQTMIHIRKTNNNTLIKIDFKCN